jgi:iron complex transport system ATP-binding protein
MNLQAEHIDIDLGSTRIVHDVTLDVAPGTLVGLIGPNGSGKSTFLRAVYRMLRPSNGRIALNGNDVWHMSAQQSAIHTAVVVQEPISDFDFSVSEIVYAGRTPHKSLFSRDSPEDHDIVRSALDRVGLLAHAQRSFGSLSGGEKQRVLIARALAQQPRVLILDEPTNHLDIRFQLEILALLRAIGITTLITLHDLNLAASFCHRLYLLSAGRIVAAGEPRDVLTPAIIRQVFHVNAVCSEHPANGTLRIWFTSDQNPDPA